MNPGALYLGACMIVFFVALAVWLTNGRNP